MRAKQSLLALVVIAVLALLVVPGSSTPSPTSADATVAGRPVWKGNCDNPRVRKEWRTLTRQEQISFNEAVQCLKRKPHDSRLRTVAPSHLSGVPNINPKSTFWDDLVYVHATCTPLVHFTGLFLAWHRLFVYNVETELQNCGFPKNLGMPYWNWTLDYKDGLDKAPLWGTEPWQIGPATGTGKNWIVEEFPEMVAYPSPHRISRRYNRHPFRKSVESEVLTSSFAANSKVAATNTKVANNTVLPNHIIQKAKEQTGHTRRSKLAKGEKPESIKPANQPKRLSPSDLAKRFSTEEKAFKGSLSQKVKEDDETTNMTGEEMVSPEAIRWVFEARDGDYETFAQRVEGTPHVAAHESFSIHNLDINYSPESSHFYLHHCMVEQEWYSWQKRSPLNQGAIGGKQTQSEHEGLGVGNAVTYDTILPMAGIWPDQKVRDVLDPRGNAPLCYEYQ
ncbi:Di-copper centre-containing protein [Acaromyces ingoldii]|uniref:Di-copper centre-containing protein n=1 Tax=Acaromyces ingoldii TaxID=215250 RepID=A0A316YS64_9BASI|nr:Di-copper centre-containing protein [Acaromyces ingoldii]PWN92400.1 Di-copper centre-containing protein [Acaromyces ingoldii]